MGTLRRALRTLLVVLSLAVSLMAISPVGDASTAARRIPAASSKAASAGCVTRAEYKRVHRGMPKKRVGRIFKARAGPYSQVSSTEAEYRYRQCRRDPTFGRLFTIIRFVRADETAPYRLRQKSWNNLDIS